jgi:hypothetical protein
MLVLSNVLRLRYSRPMKDEIDESSLRVLGN